MSLQGQVTDAFCTWQCVMLVFPSARVVLLQGVGRLLHGPMLLKEKKMWEDIFEDTASNFTMVSGGDISFRIMVGLSWVTHTTTVIDRGRREGKTGRCPDQDANKLSLLLIYLVPFWTQPFAQSNKGEVLRPCVSRTNSWEIKEPPRQLFLHTLTFFFSLGVGGSELIPINLIKDVWENAAKRGED